MAEYSRRSLRRPCRRALLAAWTVPQHRRPRDGRVLLVGSRLLRNLRRGDGVNAGDPWRGIGHTLLSWWFGAAAPSGTRARGTHPGGRANPHGKGAKNRPQMNGRRIKRPQNKRPQNKRPQNKTAGPITGGQVNTRQNGPVNRRSCKSLKTNREAPADSPLPRFRPVSRVTAANLTAAAGATSL